MPLFQISKSFLMPNLNRTLMKRNRIKTWKIFRGDLVQVMKGKDAGKQGYVKKVYRKKNRLFVEGCNLRRRMERSGNQQGSVVIKESPIHYSNVKLVDPKTGKPTKAGYKFLENGKKVRYAKVSGEIIPKPLSVRKPRKKPYNTSKDTPPELANKKTYKRSEYEALKARYMRRFELKYYNHLRQVYENKLKKERVAEFEKLKFQHEVFERAKVLAKMELEGTEEVEKQFKAAAAGRRATAIEVSMAANAATFQPSRILEGLDKSKLSPEQLALLPALAKKSKGKVESAVAQQPFMCQQPEQ